jgi:hypothetical protein
MAQHPSKVIGAAGEVVGRGGKIVHVSIALTGDRVYELRSVDVTGDVKYKLSVSVEVPHNDLNIPFKTALYAKVVSGTTGEINVVYD